MASVTYEDIRAFWARKAPWLLPVISTWSTTGTTARGTDTVVWTDTGSTGLTAETLNNMHVFQPDDAVAGDRKRRLGGNSGSALDTTNGYIYPLVAWANAPQSGEQYEISAIDPQTMFNLLVDTLDQFYIPAYGRVSQFTDADMTVSGVTNYTASGAGSLSKVVTAVTNEVGPQALFFNAGTAGENVRTVTIRVVPERQYEAWATYRVDAGGPVYFAIWDETNSAEIESANRAGHSLERYCSVRRTFTTPAGCEEITLRIYVTGGTDDVYISGFSGPRKLSDTVFPAPSTMESSKYLRKLAIAHYGDQIDTNVYDASSRTLEEIDRDTFFVRVAHHHINPYNIEMRPGYQLPAGELWVERMQKTSEVTTLAWTAAGETSPAVPLPKALIGWASLKKICEHILSYSPTDSEVSATLRQIVMRGSEYNSLMADFVSDLESPSFNPPTRQWSLTQL